MEKMEYVSAELEVFGFAETDIIRTSNTSSNTTSTTSEYELPPENF